MTVFQLLLMMLAFITIGLFVAPIESLGWWVKSGAKDAAKVADHTRKITIENSKTGHFSTSDHFLVYLSGIGVIAGDSLPHKEIAMVEVLRERLGGTEVICDVYPYSPQNLGLTTNRPFSWMWRRLWNLKGSKAAALASLINIRNATQMLVSADSRYGPVYNSGVALRIWESLLAHGYDPNERKPVTLLGWSGGGQIAVAAAWYLASFGVPVYVLSMAGIVSSDPGLDRIEHMWHLYGTRDRVHKISKVIFAGRWPIWRKSAWYRAVKAGKIENIVIGPLCHMGKNEYFDIKPDLPGGHTGFGITADAIVKTLCDAGLASDLGTPNPGLIRLPNADTA